VNIVINKESKVGLDMYAYTAAKAGQQNEFYEGAEWDPELKESVNPTVVKPRELAYWRKHPNLHGWMERLWENKGRPGSAPDSPFGDGAMFNGVELELTWEDLDELERVVTHGQLPSTQGFFFGDGADDFYKEQDLEFIKNARAELFLGLKVFYNSSW
jgi:hypothetical protein